MIYCVFILVVIECWYWDAGTLCAQAVHDNHLVNGHGDKPIIRRSADRNALELDYDAHILRHSVVREFDDALDNTACATTDGTPCIFPFAYKGKSINGCTLADHTEWWCATHVDEQNGDSATSFGICAEACPKVCETTAASGNVLPCVFPFNYKDVMYKTCTAFEASGAEWCATVVDSSNTTTSVGGSCNTASCTHEVCATTDSTVENPHHCIFPFKYKGVMLNGCTDADHTHYWCATAIDGQLAATAFGNCIDSCPQALTTTTTTTSTTTTKTDLTLTNTSVDVADNSSVETDGGNHSSSYNTSNRTEINSDGTGTSSSSSGVRNESDSVNGSQQIVHSQKTGGGAHGGGTGDNDKVARKDTTNANGGKKKVTTDASIKTKSTDSRHVTKETTVENSSWSDNTHLNKSEAWNVTEGDDDPDAKGDSMRTRGNSKPSESGGNSGDTPGSGDDEGDTSWSDWIFGQR